MSSLPCLACRENRLLQHSGLRRETRSRLTRSAYLSPEYTTRGRTRPHGKGKACALPSSLSRIEAVCHDGGLLHLRGDAWLASPGTGTSEGAGIGKPGSGASGRREHAARLVAAGWRYIMWAYLASPGISVARGGTRAG